MTHFFSHPPLHCTLLLLIMRVKTRHESICVIHSCKLIIKSVQYQRANTFNPI